MTDEQKISAEAWATVFSESAATTRVFDEAVQFVRSMSPAEQVGASMLMVWAMSKRTQVRRAKHKGAK